MFLSASPPTSGQYVLWGREESYSEKKKVTRGERNTAELYFKHSLATNPSFFSEPFLFSVCSGCDSMSRCQVSARKSPY